MKLLVAYLAVGLLTGCPTEGKKEVPVLKVSGKVTKSGSYCGGAFPSEETLQNAQAVIPLNGFMVYVKKGSENKLSSPVLDSASTNSDGDYSFKLPKGEYVLLRKNQLDKSVFETYSASSQLQVDVECLEAWWKKGLATITIENENIDSLNFHFRKRCFVPDYMPCLRYTGPHPP